MQLLHLSKSVQDRFDEVKITLKNKNTIETDVEIEKEKSIEQKYRIKTRLLSEKRRTEIKAKLTSKSIKKMKSNL